MTNTELIAELKSMIQEKKWNLFQQILQYRTRYLTVVLENLELQHNLSAVLRSCDCFGVQDIHVIDAHFEEDLNPKVEKGAAQWLTLNPHPTTHSCFNSLKNQGYKIVVTSPRANKFMQDIPVNNQKIALVFGNEIKGVRSKGKNT